MSTIRKTYETKQEDGWWVASTPAVDRDRDRIEPLGLDLTNYRNNPVIVWAHDYRSPHSIIGRAAEMQVSDRDFRIKPEWREPASESDPMHIIRSLIDAKLARALSIGFNPLEFAENEKGGVDYTRAEILEISLVPIPANQEALRLAVKALGGDDLLLALDDEPAAAKPYPEEHACRLRDPGDFEEGSFRSTTRESDGKPYRIIMGRLQGETTMTEQAYRYNKSDWSAEEARAHCSAHEGRFEAAQRGLDEDTAETEEVQAEAPAPEPVDEPAPVQAEATGNEAATNKPTPEEMDRITEAFVTWFDTIREVLRDE